MAKCRWSNEFSSRRYPGWPKAGRYGKRLTHRLERLEAKREIAAEVATLPYGAITLSPKEN